MNCDFNNCFVCPYLDCIIKNPQGVSPNLRKTDKIDWSMESKKEIDKRRLDDVIRNLKELSAAL